MEVVTQAKSNAVAYEYLNSNTTEEQENGDFIITMKVPFERMCFHYSWVSATRYRCLSQSN
jgi:hypothetical protein